MSISPNDNAAGLRRELGSARKIQSSRAVKSAVQKHARWADDLIPLDTLQRWFSEAE
jgi:hypothetical protein